MEEKIEYVEDTNVPTMEEPIVEDDKPTYSLLGIELSFEEFDRLICEQNKGKELVVENGIVVARDRVVTQEDLDRVRLAELENWFNNYFDKQLTQSLWQDDFIVSHDTYFDKDYASVDELKVQAEVVRQEIKELRNNLGG